ncbi:HAD family hydrolase [Desulfocurvus sp. DL9XJH121]
MLHFDIPGRAPLVLEHLVLDLNGTLCADGELLTGLVPPLSSLAANLAIHAVTADTHGKAAELLRGLPLTVRVLPPGGEDEAKRNFVRHLGPGRTAAMGNGANDRLMLAEAALGVALIQAEGACAQAVAAADVVCTDIRDALNLLLRPQRLIATLRT